MSTNQRRLFTDAEIADMLAMYEQTHSSVLVGKKYHYFVGGVTRILKEHGVHIWQSRAFTDEQEEEITHEYLDGKSTRAIAKERGVDKIAIISALSRQGIEQRDPSARNRLYQLDPNVFDVIGPEAAYWWGFLYADGYVHREKTLVVGLQASDLEQLIKLGKFLKSEAKIKYRSRTVKGKSYMACELMVTDKHLGKCLLDLGIVPNRTNFVSVLGNLPPLFYRDWIRGLFDGDGSASIRKIYGSPQIRFCGREDVADWIANILCLEIGYKGKPYKHTKSCVYYITLSGRNIVREAMNYMYQNASTWMDRKKNKLESAYTE